MCVHASSVVWFCSVTLVRELARFGDVFNDFNFLVGIRRIYMNGAVLVVRIGRIPMYTMFEEKKSIVN